MMIMLWFKINKSEENFNQNSESHEQDELRVELVGLDSANTI